MEKFQLINYKSNPAVKIETEHLNELKRGEYCEFAEYLKLAPEEENLIIEMLPEEVLLYIFQFLSPGDLIRVALTCQTLNELSQDKNTWRNVSYNYNQFFIFDKVEVEKRTYIYQENQIPIYGIIEESYLKTDVDENSPLINPKQKLQKTKSLSALLRRRNQYNLYAEEDQIDNLFDQNETKEKLIEYIEKVPNPKEELISKANLIYNGMKERKEQLKENLKRREEYDKRWKKIRKLESCSFINLLFLAIGFTAFLITLNVYIEKKLSSNVTYVFIPILLPILIYAVLLFYWLKFERDFIFSIFGISMTILFIQLILIGLRASSTIKGSWLLIFLPFLIFFGIIIIISVIWIYHEYQFVWVYTTPTMVSTMIFLFLIFLGLRLDGTTKWNYGIIFIPLFFINFFPCWMSCSFCNELYGGYTLVFLAIVFGLFLVISIPLLLLEILLVLFLEGNSNVNHISYVFIPFYIAWGLFLCWLTIFSCGYMNRLYF